MLRLCAVALALAFFSTLSSPRVAHAWTSAQVRDVRAEVVLTEPGTAQVTLDIGIEVLGGFLSRFDLEGLDEELALVDGQAAWLTTDQGVVIAAEAEVQGGAITLRFDKHEAARRGLHRIGVRYVAPLHAHAKGDNPGIAELSWSLPGWEQGLSRAEIVVRGPRGLSFVRDPDQALEITQRVEGGQSVIELVRVLVPRSTAWSVSVDGAASLFERGGRPASTPSASETVKPRSWLTGVWLSLWMVAVGFLSRRSFRVRARALGATATPWIASARVRHGLLGLSVLLAIWAARSSTPVLLTALLALGACWLERVERDLGTAPLGRFLPLDGVEQRTLRRQRLRQLLGTTPFADGATAMGALGALAVLGLSLVLAPHDEVVALGMLCALPSWAASSRLRLPRSTEEQVVLLRRAAEHALALSCSMRLVGFFVGDGACSSPRLRIVPATRFSGLLRIDVAVDTRRDAKALLLIAVAQPDSLADRALCHVFGSTLRELSPRGNRVAHIQPIDELGADLERVLSALAATGQQVVTLAEPQRAA